MGGAASGIDLVDGLAKVLVTTDAELLPEPVSPDTLPILREQAKVFFEALIKTADRETFLMFNLLRIRLNESPNQSR